jgi:hypothetical protein
MQIKFKSLSLLTQLMTACLGNLKADTKLKKLDTQYLQDKMDDEQSRKNTRAVARLALIAVLPFIKQAFLGYIAKVSLRKSAGDKDSKFPCDDPACDVCAQFKAQEAAKAAGKRSPFEHTIVHEGEGIYHVYGAECDESIEPKAGKTAEDLLKTIRRVTQPRGDERIEVKDITDDDGESAPLTAEDLSVLDADSAADAKRLLDLADDKSDGADEKRARYMVGNVPIFMDWIDSFARSYGQLDQVEAATRAIRDYFIDPLPPAAIAARLPPSAPSTSGATSPDDGRTIQTSEPIIVA